MTSKWSWHWLQVIFALFLLFFLCYTTFVLYYMAPPVSNAMLAAFNLQLNNTSLDLFFVFFCFVVAYYNLEDMFTIIIELWKWWWFNCLELLGFFITQALMDSCNLDVISSGKECVHLEFCDWSSQHFVTGVILIKAQVHIMKIFHNVFVQICMWY